MANGNGANADVLNKSVTKDDYSEGPRAGGVFHFMLPSIGNASPDLHSYWSYARDWVLYSTIYRESMWAAALYIAVTKQASKSFEVESDIPKRQKDAQKLFLSFDNNRGWVGGISKHLQAYLLTGNGGPVEIVRASGAPGSKILGLIPLDPFRTVRTGDPQIPFLYSDRRGGLHEMRAHEAFIIADQPDMMDLWYGVGHCAAERAYQAIIKMEAIERYIYEKVSGKRALALDFIAGVIPTQIEDAKRTAQAESLAKGVTTYMGSTIIALSGDSPPVHVRINLAELPDGFERKEEFDLAILTYARSIGIPVQDLQPLSGQGLGTGTQSQVLDESAKGQGLATWSKAFSHASNEFALDEKTTFYFKENDIRDREREAKVRIDEATAIGTWVTMQAVTIEQARQLGVDRDQLPREFIPEDTTEGGSLSDSEKPVEGEEAIGTLPISEPILGDETEASPTGGAPDNLQSMALNGAQVSSLMEIIFAFSRGELTLDSATALIGSAFPSILPEVIDKMLTPAEIPAETPSSAPFATDSILKTARKIYESVRGGNMGESNPRYDALLAQQEKLIDALVTQASVKAQPSDLSESVRKAVEIAHHQVSDTEEKLSGKFSELEGGIVALRTLIEQSAKASASASDVANLRKTLDHLRDAQKAQEQRQASELERIGKSVKDVAARELKVIAPPIDRKVIEQAANDALALAMLTFKHAEDLTVKQRISKRDANGLASEIERMLASGQVDVFRVVRIGGRIEYLERL